MEVLPVVKGGQNLPPKLEYQNLGVPASLEYISFRECHNIYHAIFAAVFSEFGPIKNILMAIEEVFF